MNDTSRQNKNTAVKVTLTRDLRLFDVTMIGVGAMIGAGIFVLTGLAAGQAGPALLMAFFLNGLVALFTAASYAELGAAFPEAGGGYAWVREGLSAYFGFLSGWMSWFAQAVACSLYSLGLGSFAARLLTLADISIANCPEPTMALILAVLAAAAFVVINYRGAAESGRIGSFLTVSKVVILLVLVVFGVKALSNRPDWPAHFTPFLPNGIGGVFTAMGLTAIAFEGYEIVTQSGEEVIDPGRNIPRAIFISIGLVVVVYLAVASVLLGAVEAPNGVPIWRFLSEHAEQAVVEAADQLIPYGKVLMLIGGVMSTLSALNATLYSSSRISFAMGRNRDLPDIFGEVHPIRHTPHWAVVFSGVLVILMALLLPIQDVASAASIIFMLLFVMVNTSAITLRRRSDVRRPFKVPLMPLFPLLGIVSQLFLSIYLFNLSPIAWYTTLAWIVGGSIFYAAYAARAPAMPEPVAVIHEEIVAVTEYSVLIPVAGAAQARMLGNLGSAVARDRDGEVFALHVVRVPRQLSITDGRYFLKQGKPILETVIDEAQKRDVPVHTMIRLGRTVANAIVETARERGTDLMILSWPGYTETPEAAFGSVIDLVAANPPCDLAVVRFRKKVPLHHILVATAGGPHAELALEIAMSQARQFKLESGQASEITLLHVVPEAADDVAMEQAERMLANIASHYDYPLSQKIIRADDVAGGIVEESEHHDLLLIGATGEGLFGQRLLGSIPERVAREAAITVTMTKRYWRLKSLISRVGGSV
jgi:amino acid transporter/nucleotide-binding universal stress UspA family protein